MSHPRCLPLRGQGRFAGPGNALPVFLKKGPDRAQKAHRPGPAAPNKNCGVPRIFRRPTPPRPAAPPAAGAGKGNRVSVPPPGARLQERVPCGRGGPQGASVQAETAGPRAVSPPPNAAGPSAPPRPSRSARRRKSGCRILESGGLHTARAAGSGCRALGTWCVPRREGDGSRTPSTGTRRASHRARAAEAGRGALGPGRLHTARAAEAGRRSRAHFHEAAPRPHPFRRFSAAGPLGRPGTTVFKPSGKGVGTVLKEKGRSRTKPNGARPTPPRPQGAARQGCGRGVSPRRAVGEGRGASGPHFFIAERQRQGGAFK